MKWSAWVYFNNNWEDDPGLKDLRQQRAAGKITRPEYKTGIQRVKQGVLQRMLVEGRITESDILNPQPPRPKKVRRPARIGQKVPISKALPAHGKARVLTPWKYSSEVAGGLPGLGKR